MKQEHTPGPWVYGPEFSAVVTRDKQGTVAILLPLGYTRDNEDIDTEMMDAHGRLMAAAPEMYDALRDLYNASVLQSIPFDAAWQKAISLYEELTAKIEGDE